MKETVDLNIKSDYSHLEGKEIIYKYEDFDGIREIPSIVVGVDYDIGITIINAKDHEDYVMCLRGPSSPTFVEVEDWQTAHDTLFYEYVRMIEEGVINEDILEDKLDDVGFAPGDEEPTAASCPFGQ